MKVKIKTTKVYDVKYISFQIPIIDDGDFEWSVEDNAFVEKYYKNLDKLSLKIDIETGHIIGWELQDFKCNFIIYSKVVDEGVYTLYDSNGNTIDSYEGYVPEILSCVDKGYGDYLSMVISPDGHIDNWCSAKLHDFIDRLDMYNIV